MGQQKKVMSLDNLHAKFEAFNWQVLEMDGNDMDLVIAGLNKAKTFIGKGKPIAINDENRNGSMALIL